MWDLFDLRLGGEAADHRRREVRRVLAKQRRWRHLDVAGRDPAQIEHRQQRIEAFRPPCLAQQDRRGETHAILSRGRAAITDLHARHRHRADPGLGLTLRLMAVAYQAQPPVRQPQIVSRRQKRLGLKLHRLHKQPASPGPAAPWSADRRHHQAGEIRQHW